MYHLARVARGGGRAGVEIRSRFDERSVHYRVFFSVLYFETGTVARFNLNVGEIRALKTLAEQAFARAERMEFTLLDDPHMLTATLIATGAALEFTLQTPFTQCRLAFRDANNLATLAFWFAWALVQRGNPLISFKREHLGMALWEHSDTLLPYARFYWGGAEAEISNLTRLKLWAIQLFSEVVMTRVIRREPRSAQEG
ncbi:MAG: hypothetical protein HYR55_15730 [Acidobacteria bacterium]|nr:hypothetical protein [Acidobacteriota bacterium]